MSDAETRRDLQASIPSALVGLGIAAVVGLAGLVFVLARQRDWTALSIYVGLQVVAIGVNGICVLLWNRELIRRRMWPGKGTKTWDIVWMLLFAPAMVAVFVVPVLEARSGIPSAPGATGVLGMALFVPGWALVTWSMVVNPFFEKTVRIQTDRGHRVIDTGPYAYLRHPGYAGFAAWFLATPLLFSSVWAFVPALLTLFALVVRTALEDRMLQAELSGYAAYAARVRFRLIPGVW